MWSRCSGILWALALGLLLCYLAIWLSVYCFQGPGNDISASLGHILSNPVPILAPYCSPCGPYCSPCGSYCSPCGQYCTHRGCIMSHRCRIGATLGTQWAPRSSKTTQNTKECYGFCKVPKSCLGAFWVSFCHPWDPNWTQQVSQRSPKGAKRSSKELHLDAKCDKLLYLGSKASQDALQSSNMS